MNSTNKTTNNDPSRTLELETIELKEQVKMLRDVLGLIDSNAAESPEWIRQRTRQALAATNPNRDVKQPFEGGRW